MNHLDLENVLRKLAKFGVAHRSELKNYPSVLRLLLRRKWVQKTSRKGSVFYEFTAAALKVLENYRMQRLLELTTLHELYPTNKVYASLVQGDLRFLNETHSLTEEYRFLSDWQFKHPVSAEQLALSQARYFEKLGALES